MSTLPSSSTLLPYFLDLLDVDFRAEVLAAALVNQQVPPERIVINPTGSYSRAYSKDIEEVSDWLLEGATFVYNRIDTPREGLFDMLPQALFFHPKASVSADNADQLLEEIRRDRDEERQARLFFLPFDAELNYLRTLAVHHDNSADHLEGAATLIEQFASYWPILKAMTPGQAGLFLQVLPLLHRLRCDLHWLGRYLSLCFGVPVRVLPNRQSAKATPAPFSAQPSLANCRLGIDAVIGNQFTDSYNGIQILVGPIPDEQLADFLPHTKTRALLNDLVDYFVPVWCDVSVSIQTPRPASDVPRPESVYLGYNAYL